MSESSRRFRNLALGALLVFGATLAHGVGEPPQPKSETPSETKTACTDAEINYCRSMKNAEGKQCMDPTWKVVGGICQCECQDVYGGKTPSKKTLPR